METTARKIRWSLILSLMMMFAQHAQADWDWQWVDGDWGHAIASCGECGEEYDIEGLESSSDIDSAVDGLFCSGCGNCSKDANEDCWLEHHCERCGDCMDAGDYNGDVYDALGLKVCDDCMYDFRDDCVEEGLGCIICKQLFEIEVTECDCEIDMAAPHCENCGGLQCEECGTHLDVPGFEIDLGCDDHLLCTYNDCYKDAAGEDGVHCGLCNSCDNGDLCEACNECENCWNHCSECDYCFTGQEIEWCKAGGGHCIHCCEDNNWICDECGECTEGKGIEFCDDCGLCEDCCDKKRDLADCSHGYCVESSDYSDHLCTSCGQCPQDTECEDCGMCESCQSDYHCEHDLCPEGAEWEEHLCNTCGNCWEVEELCEYCGRCPDCQEHCQHDLCPEGDGYDDGDHFICEQCGDCYDSDRCDECELCAGCCEANTEAMGCDHQLCVVGSEFVEHWCYEDDQCLEYCNHEENCDHDNVDVAWSSDGNAHWKLCLDCGRAVEKAIHSEGDLVVITQPDATSMRNGTAQLNCAVCEQKMSIVSVPYVEIPENGAPYIIVQPTDYTGKTSTVEWTNCPAEAVDRYATYTVRAGGKNLSYQWYEKVGTGSFKPVTEREGIYEGAQTASLKAYVYTDACDGTEYHKFYCIVSNASGNVTTNTVTVRAQHVFGHYENNGDGTHSYGCLGECGEVKKVSKHRFGEWELVRAATDVQTGLRRQKCRDCGYSNSEEIPMVEPGHVHAYNLYRTTATQHWCYCACGVQKTDEAEDHTFGEPVVTQEPTEERSGRQTLTCTVCSYEKAERLDKLPHVHDWYSFDDPEQFYYDETLGKDVKKYSYSNKQHLVRCKGCDQVKTGSHCWADFVGDADATETKKGRMVRICGVCQFSEYLYNDYGTWPVMVCGGKAYTQYKNPKTGRVTVNEVTQATPGTKIYLNYDLNWGPAFAEAYYYSNSDLKFKKWLDLKRWNEGVNDIPWGLDDKIIPELTFETPTADDDYIVARYNVNAYFVMPDGPAIVMADADECDHPASAQTTGQPKEPTCAGYGYEAGTMCSLCGKETPGTRIEALGHDLPSTPIPGTRVEEYCSTWTKSWPYYKDNVVRYGCEGDYLCNRCGNIVKGARLPLKHGLHDRDSIYAYPGKIWTDWYVAPTNTKSPTCTRNGYSGDETCKYCQKIVYRGSTEDDFAAVGHEWGPWETVREATPKLKGLERRVCLHNPEWFIDGYGEDAVAAATGIEEHEETRLVDYLPDYALKTAKTKILFEWTYGTEPAAQTVTFESAGRNAVTAIEAIRQSVEGLATVSVSGLTVTVKPIAAAVTSRYGTSCSVTLTLTRVTTDNGSLESEDTTQPIQLVMSVKKATPALSIAQTSQTVEIGTSAASPQVANVADGMMLTWRSADNSIATVNAETGVVTPIAEGTTTITATFAGNTFYTSASASYTLHTKKGEAGLAFEQKGYVVPEGSAFLMPKLMNPKHLTVTYSSSNPAVATVNAITGAITIKGRGATTITASSAATKRVVAGSASFRLVVGDAPKGDINGDAEVTVADVAQLVMVLLGHASPNDACRVNSDTVVDKNDLKALIDILLGRTQ